MLAFSRYPKRVAGLEPIHPRSMKLGSGLAKDWFLNALEGANIVSTLEAEDQVFENFKFGNKGIGKRTDNWGGGRRTEKSSRPPSSSKVRGVSGSMDLVSSSSASIFSDQKLSGIRLS